MYRFYIYIAAILFFNAAHAQPATYAIDSHHSVVAFEIETQSATPIRGTFDNKAGHFTFDAANKSGLVELSIDTGSISSGSALMDGLLKGSQLFDVTVFPSATFTSKKLVFKDEKIVAIVGSLTLLGKTNPVTLKAIKFDCYLHPDRKVDVCNGEFETTILRSQWGMTWGVSFGILDSVTLAIQVLASKQQRSLHPRIFPVPTL